MGGVGYLQKLNHKLRWLNGEVELQLRLLSPKIGTCGRSEAGAGWNRMGRLAM